MIRRESGKENSIAVFQCVSSASLCSQSYQKITDRSSMSANNLLHSRTLMQFSNSIPSSLHRQPSAEHPVSQQEAKHR